MKKAQTAISLFVSIFLSSILRIPLGVAFNQIFSVNTSNWGSAGVLWDFLPFVILLSIIFFVVNTVISLISE